MNNDNALLSDPIIKERATAQTDPVINYFVLIPDKSRNLSLFEVIGKKQMMKQMQKLHFYWKGSYIINILMSVLNILIFNFSSVY